MRSSELPDEPVAFPFGRQNHARFFCILRFHALVERGVHCVAEIGAEVAYRARLICPRARLSGGFQDARLEFAAAADTADAGDLDGSGGRGFRHRALSAHSSRRR